MRYEWDVSKAEANARKHGVRFADAVGVLADESAVTVYDPEAGEERYVTMGYGWTHAGPPGGLHVEGAYTLRLISARRATRSETSQYVRGES